MSQSTQVYITDKTGKRFWNTCCSIAFKAPELRNLARHLETAKLNPDYYAFLDIETARIVDESADLDSILDSELLRELME